MLAHTHSRHVKSLLRLVSGSRTQLSQSPARSHWVTSPTTQARTMSKWPASRSAGKTIFDSDESGWDHVFKDFGTTPRDSRAMHGSQRNTRRHRPSQLTEQEVNAFGQMYSMLFDSHSDNNGHGLVDPLSKYSTPSIGNRYLADTSNLALHLRHRSRNVVWTSEADEELDRKKEAMNLCNTDQELMEWALREVFGESERYEKMARDSSWSSQKSLQLQPPSYPHVIALLMKTFRDKYADPYLALSVFQHAKHLSAASYVFGCTSHAYNELIATRWRCFRDLRGVCDALEEMRANGIEMDLRTRGWAEMVRREVGERNLWEEESITGTGEVWDLVGRIERLTSTKRLQRQNHQKKWLPVGEPWKQEIGQEAWQFNSWPDNREMHS